MGPRVRLLMLAPDELLTIVILRYMDGAWPPSGHPMWIYIGPIQSQWTLSHVTPFFQPTYISDGSQMF